jgi:hypothetical protein
VFALPGGLRAGSLSPAVRALSAPRDAEAEAQTLQTAAKALPGGPRSLPRREAKALRAALEALHLWASAGFVVGRAAGEARGGHGDGAQGVGQV